jgi:hypothetical protein
MKMSDSIDWEALAYGDAERYFLTHDQIYEFTFGYLSHMIRDHGSDLTLENIQSIEKGLSRALHDNSTADDIHHR